MASVEELLRSSTLFRNLCAEDQKRLAAVSLVKTIPAGKEIILEIFGPGDRWGKEGVVATERDGFLVKDEAALERLAET